MTARFVLSLDFELAWGSPEHWSNDAFLARALKARDAALSILEACAEYDIHATWAIVGALFADNYEHFLEFAPPEQLRPGYIDRRLSPYSHLDRIRESGRNAFFCPEIIKSVAEIENQEISSHTFSHYFCLEPGASANTFVADLDSFRRITANWNITGTSLVFPRNQVDRECLNVLHQKGFTAYRGTERSALWKARPRSKRTTLVRALRVADAFLPLSGGKLHTQFDEPYNGLFNVPSSRFLRPYSSKMKILDGMKLGRIRSEMRRAAELGAIYHLWFHPENFATHLQENLRFFKLVLSDYRSLSEQELMKSMSMSEVVEGLSKNERQ